MSSPLTPDTKLAMTSRWGCRLIQRATPLSIICLLLVLLTGLLIIALPRHLETFESTSVGESTHFLPVDESVIEKIRHEAEENDSFGEGRDQLSQREVESGAAEYSGKKTPDEGWQLGGKNEKAKGLLLLHRDIMFGYEPPKERRTSPGSTHNRPVCVVEASNSGKCHKYNFAQFLLFSMEQVVVCRLLRLPVIVTWTGCTDCGAADGSNYYTHWFSLPEPGSKAEKLARRQGALCLGDSVSNFSALAQLFRPGGEGEELERIKDGAGPASQLESVGKGVPKASKEVRQAVHKLVKMYASPKPWLKKKVAKFAGQHFTGKVVIGVHIPEKDEETAGTNEGGQHSKVDFWTEEIKNQLTKMGLSSSKGGSAKNVAIFLATNDTKLVAGLQKMFPKSVFILPEEDNDPAGPKKEVKKDTPSTSDEEENGGEDSYPPKNRHVQEILLLSECNYVIYDRRAPSVAILASYYNPKLKLVAAKQKPSADKVEEKGFEEGVDSDDHKSQHKPQSSSFLQTEVGSKRDDPAEKEFLKVVTDQETKLKCLSRNVQFTACQDILHATNLGEPFHVLLSSFSIRLAGKYQAYTQEVARDRRGLNGGLVLKLLKS